jgi:hypothetical protein
MRKESMTIKGSIALGDVAARAIHVDVACLRCDRRGRYQLERLVANHGADFPMTNLGAELANCPRRAAPTHPERCEVFFPNLRAIMDDPASETDARRSPHLRAKELYGLASRVVTVLLLQCAPTLENT